MKSKPIEGIKSTENPGMKYSSYLDEKDFNEMILDGRTEEEYLEDYCKLIDQALQRGLKRGKIEFYTEKHHILPRCMSGEDENYNYVLLSALEHIIAHVLLYRIQSDNNKILSALFCMINVNSVYTSERKLVIEKYNITLSAELREKYIRSISYPVVCHDLINKVYRVYSSISETEMDGFNHTSVSSTVKGDYNTSRGYKFSLLEDFKINYPEKLNEFYSLKDLPKLNLTPLERNTVLEYNDSGTKIVCFDKNFNVCKIYNTISSIKIDGFNPEYLRRSIENKTLYGEYYWMYYNDAINLYSNSIQKFYEKGAISNIIKYIPRETKRSKKIICHDKDYLIYKIYDSVKDVIKDGFSESSVSAAVNRNKTRTSYFAIGKYFDYYWTSLDEWEYSDKLDEYYLNKETNNLPKLVVKLFRNEIIRTNRNHEIIKIYKSIGNVREDGLFHQNVWRILNKDKKLNTESLYNNSYWFKFSDFKEKYPDKLEEYYKQQEQK
jgi:hypothetical protein